MKININRRLIQGIIDSANPEFIYSMDEKIQNIIVNVVDDLSNRCPYVSLNTLLCVTTVTAVQKRTNVGRTLCH